MLRSLSLSLSLFESSLFSQFQQPAEVETIIRLNIEQISAEEKLLFSFCKTMFFNQQVSENKERQAYSKEYIPYGGSEGKFFESGTTNMLVPISDMAPPSGSRTNNTDV